MPRRRAGMLHEREKPAHAPSESASQQALAGGGAWQRVRGLAQLAIGAVAVIAWLALVTWRLERVPGMSLDEAWSILSARGQWPPHDPLSGMTSYAGPFPVLLLELLGTERGVLVLRAASVLANGAALALIGLLLRRAYPGRGIVVWALPLIATCPVWLVVLRTGIEVVMFTPLLAVLGLYLLGSRSRWAWFAGGLSWGLLIYNHVIGGCLALAVVLAGRVAFQRWPMRQLVPALAGVALGITPRLAALLLYHERLIEGTAEGYSLRGAIGDLRWVPICLWRTWQGDTVYLRYVGRLAEQPWPYWALAGVFVLPWVRRLRQVPPVAWFTLLCAVFSALAMTLAAPYMAVRFMIVPIAAATAFICLLGAAAIDADARWRAPIILAALALTGLNLYYYVSNFQLPWQNNQLSLTTFWLGDRSKRTGNWAYFPKEELVRQLLALRPAPEQIVTTPTLERPLRVLLDGSPLRVKLPTDADPALSSIYVDYRKPDALGPHCAEVPGGRLCFAEPVAMADYFLVYR